MRKLVSAGLARVLWPQGLLGPIAVRQFANTKLDLVSNLDYLTAKSFHAYTTLFSLISLILLVIFLITYKPLSSKPMD